MNSQEGPLLDELNKNLDGVILRELITYRFADGILNKEVVSRRWGFAGDYHDTRQVTPLLDRSI